MTIGVHINININVNINTNLGVDAVLSDVRKPLPAPTGGSRRFRGGAGRGGRDGDHPGHCRAGGKLGVSLQMLSLAVMS